MFAFESVLISHSRHEVSVIVRVVGISGDVIGIVLVVGGGQFDNGGVVFVLVILIFGGWVHVAVVEGRCLV